MGVVKSIWDVLEQDGGEAATEALLAHSHPDLELRPYSADGRTLRGHEEVRRFFRENTSGGRSVHAIAFSFSEEDGAVVVSGSIRVHRGDGSIADATLRWTFGFSGDRIAHVVFAPLAAGVSP